MWANWRREGKQEGRRSKKSARKKHPKWGSIGKGGKGEWRKWYELRILTNKERKGDGWVVVWKNDKHKKERMCANFYFLLLCSPSWSIRDGSCTHRQLDVSLRYAITNPLCKSQQQCWSIEGLDAPLSIKDKTNQIRQTKQPAFLHCTSFTLLTLLLLPLLLLSPFQLTAFPSAHLFEYISVSFLLVHFIKPTHLLPFIFPQLLTPRVSFSSLTRSPQRTNSRTTSHIQPWTWTSPPSSISSLLPTSARSTMSLVATSVSSRKNTPKADRRAGVHYSIKIMNSQI